MSLDNQQIFDTVARHLAAQGHRSVRPGGTSYAGDAICLYRAPNGDKCAAGVLIPDEVYNPAIERMSIESTSEEMTRVRKESGISDSSLPLVFALQRAHDTTDLYAIRAAPIRDRLAHAAERFKLSPAVLETLTFPKEWK